jgi:hypothetical protein
MSKSRKVVSRKPYVGKKKSAWTALAYIVHDSVSVIQAMPLKVNLLQEFERRDWKFFKVDLQH